MLNLREVKRSLRTLTSKELVKLEAWLHTLIDLKETRRREPCGAKQHEVPESRQTPHKTYRLEVVRCGKKVCKCTEGHLHGPYWYAYWSEKGKTRSQYIGKELPKGIRDNLLT